LFRISFSFPFFFAWFSLAEQNAVQYTGQGWFEFDLLRQDKTLDTNQDFCKFFFAKYNWQNSYENEPQTFTRVLKDADKQYFNHATDRNVCIWYVVMSKT
jgi:hypothetical protein